MPAIHTCTTKANGNEDRLRSLIEQRVNEEPFEHNGFLWVAEPQDRFCQQPGILDQTLRRWNSRPDAPPQSKMERRRMYKRADVERWVEQVRED
jgi:hypothetical protein